MSELLIREFGFGRTICSSFQLSGVTRQSGYKETVMTIRPNAEGLKFVIRNEDELYEIPVTYSNLCDPQGDHTSVLTNELGQRVGTVEHILSALAGMGIDFATIELEGNNEVPILDHSAFLFVESILTSGSRETNVCRKVVVVKQNIYFYKDGSFAILTPSKFDKTIISALIQFEAPIGEQYLSIELNPDNYRRDVAWARSFIRRSCFQAVWEMCRRNVNFLPENIEDCPIPVFRDGEWIVKTKGEGESIRHKILDLIGDLATLGYPIMGNISVIRPGHEFNRSLVSYLNGLIELENE